MLFQQDDQRQQEIVSLIYGTLIHGYFTNVCRALLCHALRDNRSAK